MIKVECAFLIKDKNNGILIMKNVYFHKNVTFFIYEEDEPIIPIIQKKDIKQKKNIYNLIKKIYFKLYYYVIRIRNYKL